MAANNQASRDGRKYMTLMGAVIKEKEMKDITHDLMNCAFNGLELVGCTISQTLLLEVAKVLRDSKLDYLKLTGSAVSMQVFQAISIAIQESRLKHLDLSNTAMAKDSFKHLALALVDSGIETLRLNSNFVGGGLHHLTKVLMENKTALKRLYLEGNELGDAGAFEIAKIIQHSGVRCLSLKDNRIASNGAITLCSVISWAQPSIYYLSLAANPIASSECIAAMYPMLKLTTLEHLCLDMCGLRDEHLVLLAQGVCVSKTLKTLEIKANTELNDAAMYQFMDAIARHPTLCTVSIDWNSFSNECIAYVKEKLKIMRSFKTQALVAMMSAVSVPRLGPKSTIKVLPHEIIRSLGIYLSH